MGRRALNPTRMAMLAMAGACVMTASLLLLAIPHASLPPRSSLSLASFLWSRRPLVLVGFGPLLLGGGLVLWAKRQLYRSFLDDAWSEAERLAVLRIVNLRVWRMGALFFVAGWLFLLFQRHTLLGGGMMYLLLTPSQVAQSIRSQVAPTTPVSTGLGGWGSFPRLRSEHWGEGRP